jgi:uncharacterized repeat protein (TIGR03803 family)
MAAHSIMYSHSDRRADRRTKFMGIVVFLFVCALGLGRDAWAVKERILHNFNDVGGDGVLPESTLISDASGNLYGTASTGGRGGSGIVFELTRDRSGWTENILYTFSYQGTDGRYPMAGLTLDAAGNLYGTTETGGVFDYGTVFQLIRGTNGQWTETVLHSFNLNGVDGAFPEASLIFDSGGNLYGTTHRGGTSVCSGQGCGTVFELKRGVGGQWAETVLYSFSGKDGYNPVAQLILDVVGNLYGTTVDGGANGVGTVFELSPGIDRKWTETVLQNFSKRGNAGNKPHVGLAFDSAGNLYGANLQGGALRRGTVFELIHRANGRWRTKVLHSFADNEGMNPLSTPIFDDVGNLYGITTNGGSFQVGTVFELKLRADGEWTETTLHTFLSGGTDGGYPVGLHRDIVGHLYGVTFEGGTGSSCYPSACGTVFEVSPK